MRFVRVWRRARTVFSIGMASRSPGSATRTGPISGLPCRSPASTMAAVIAEFACIVAERQGVENALRRAVGPLSVAGRRPSGEEMGRSRLLQGFGRPGAVYITEAELLPDQGTPHAAAQQAGEDSRCLGGIVHGHRQGRISGEGDQAGHAVQALPDAGRRSLSVALLGPGRPVGRRSAGARRLETLDRPGTPQRLSRDDAFAGGFALRVRAGVRSHRHRPFREDADDASAGTATCRPRSGFA